MTRGLKYLREVTTLELSVEKCIGCGMCREVCPHGVLVIENGRAAITDRDACMECGACWRNCPVEAITVQAGVGCAQAVINSALGRGGCCSQEAPGTEGPTCGPEGVDCGCGDPAPQEKGSGCC